jgi:hypothetical protein
MNNRLLVLVAVSCVFTTVMGIPVNLVSDYLQEYHGLAEPARIAFVVVCLALIQGLQILVAVKLSRKGWKVIQVRQRARRIGRRGTMIGVQADQAFSPAIVDQEVDDIAGQVTGLRTGQTEANQMAGREASAAAEAGGARQEPE